MSATRYLGNPCKHGHDGWRLAANGDCVVCHRVRSSAINKNRRAKIRAQRHTPTGWIGVTLSTLKRRARTQAVPFDLRKTDLVLPVVCPVFGTTLVYDRNQDFENAASVDRIKPELGYIRGNIAIISLKANMMKQRCTDPEDFRRLAAWLERAG